MKILAGHGGCLASHLDISSTIVYCQYCVISTNNDALVRVRAALFLRLPSMI